MPHKKVNIKDRSEDLDLGKDEKEFFLKLYDSVEQDWDDMQLWRMKLVTAENQRQGVKTIVSQPYDGAPDISVPETDKLIEKSKPNLVLSLWSQKKMAAVAVEQGVRKNPQYDEKAKRSEEAFNLVLRKKIGFFDVLELSSDYAKVKGLTVARIIEKFCTFEREVAVDLDEMDQRFPGTTKSLKRMKNQELRQYLIERYGFEPEDEEDEKEIKDVIEQFRSGKRILRFSVNVVESYACPEVIDPSKFIVPAYTTDINQSPRVTIEYRMTKEKLEKMMSSETFIRKDVESLIKRSKSRSEDYEKENTENLESIIDSTSEKDTLLLRETACIVKTKSMKKPERWVYTYVCGLKNVEEGILQRIRFPFEFDGWNYEVYYNERISPRHYSSRGTPEKIRMLQEVLDRSMTNMLIRDEQNNTPAMQVLKTSDIIRRNEFFYPGEFIPVDQINSEIAPINQTNIPDLSSERIMQIAKAYTEEYQSSPDQLFRNATNVGGGKTLGEIREGIRITQGPVTEDIVRWNEFWSRVFRKMFIIMRDRLGSSIYLSDGSEATSEDFNFPFEIQANGTLEVTDQEMATYKAFNRYQVVSSPANVDFVTVEDRYNSYKDWLEKDGVKDPDMFSTNPEEVLTDKINQMAIQLRQMQQQAQQIGLQIQEGQKENAKLKKNSSETVNRAAGELEAVFDQAPKQNRMSNGAQKEAR